MFIYKGNLNTITRTGNWYKHVVQRTKLTFETFFSFLWPCTGVWNSLFHRMFPMDVPNQEMWCMRPVWIHRARSLLDLQPKRSEGPLTYQRNAVGLSPIFCSPSIIRSHVKLCPLLLFHREGLYHLLNWHRQWNNPFCQISDRSRIWTCSKFKSKKFVSQWYFIKTLSPFHHRSTSLTIQPD